jgi:3-deoxy-D-manno-octulosonate 8-phosphate phosphatase (KDO 8-P phosphatase)
VTRESRVSARGSFLDDPEAGVAGGGIPVDVARAIRLVILDVDGVLTDAGVYLGRLPSGETLELKRFDIQDGLAVKLLAGAGITPVVVSGRVSAATDIRMQELGVEVHQDPDARKLPVVERLMEERGIGWSQVAMIGDDLPDLPLLSRCGLPVAVGNAVPEVTRVCTWHTTREGGRGAVREFVRALLMARGEWEQVVDRYVAEKEGRA